MRDSPIPSRTSQDGNLRDALAVALYGIVGREAAFNPAWPPGWHTRSADAVLADPAFRAALTDAIAKALTDAEAVCEAAVVIRDGSHLIHDTDYNTDPLWQALYVWQEARR